MKKILAIDGGGIRGIVPAMILTRIEEQMKKPIAQLFDLIAGTSTGGIIALGLTKPHPQDKQRPHYAAQKLVELYRDNGAQIFKEKTWKKIMSLGYTADEKYTADGIEAMLNNYFGNTKISEALIETMITAYEIEKRSNHFFKRSTARNNISDDYFMRDVARATSAAPTYFEPAKIKSLDKNSINEYYALIDGGMVANNPAMCAYVEAKKLFGDQEELMLVSLGTGNSFRQFKYKKARNWGLIEWAKPIIDIMFDAVNNSTDHQLNVLLNRGKSGKDRRYFRIDAGIRIESQNDLDNSTPDNIKSLIDFSEDIIEAFSMKFGYIPQICDLLEKASSTNPPQS